MADVGYYVQYLIDMSNNKVLPQPNDTCLVICIGEDATAKYARYLNSTNWNTLNWNVAPSRKFMQEKNNTVPVDKGQLFENRYEYYPTWQEFVEKCSIPVAPISKQIKAPNDTFSP
jgi:hypothetical protein